MIGINTHSNLQYLYRNTGKDYKLSFSQQRAVEETVQQVYKKDEDYRAKLAQSINFSPQQLKSVMGAEELKYILEHELKPENFSTGRDFENVHKGTFRVNLHMHTQYSDGNMSVKQLLDKAADYAKGKPKPVVVAITDHDTLSGAREAIKIIAQNPEKYKNIRFVPGIEFSAFHQVSPQDKRQLEVVGYCVNPFKTNNPKDKDVAKFVDNIRSQNENYLKGIVEGQLNKWEGDAGIAEDKLTTPEQFRKLSKYADILGSPGFLNGITDAFNKVFKQHGWQRRQNDGVDNIEKDYIKKTGNRGITPGTPSVEQITNVVNASGDGFVGIAHPGRNLGGIDLRFLFPAFKRLGVDAAEANYQYQPNNGVDYKFIKHINLAVEQANMLKTGGIDNHSDSIFTNR